MVGESSSFGLRSVRGGVTPRTGFLGAMGTNALSVISLRTGRFSEGPEFGLANYFWAGPHRTNNNLVLFMINCENIMDMAPFPNKFTYF